MAILVTSKYEEGARVATTQNNDFSNTQGLLTPQLEVGPPIRDIMVVLVTCKNEEDPIKNGDFSSGSRTANSAI